MEIYLACNDRNLFFSEEENSADVNKYYVCQDEAEDAAVDDYVLVLSRQIPDKSRVLDVGCAQGKFGRVLSQKDCVLWGIDINRASIRFVNARGHYQKAFVCDATRPDSKEFQQLRQTEKFDVIILSDILEHLADPTSVLLHLYPLLSEDGYFLISVPNVANLDICFHLLEGRFHYSSLGILDNTHLKFFTRESFVQWIELLNEAHPDQKLYCSYLGSSYYESGYVKELKKNYPHLFRIAAQRPEYNALQLFFRLDRNQNHQKQELEDQSGGQISVVSSLGDALEGKMVHGAQVKLALSEREFLMEKIEKREAACAQQEEFLKYREAQLKELEEAIAQKDAWIAQQEEFLEYREAQLKELEEAIAQKDAWIAQQEEFLKYREAQLKEFDAAVSKKDEAIAQKDAWIAQQAEFLAYRETQLKEKAAAVSDLDEQVKQLNMGLQDYQAQLTQKDDTLADQAETIELLRVELELVKKRLAEIENSRLWRMTRLLHD